MPETFRNPFFENGPTENTAQLRETFDHLSHDQLRKRWSITIEPLDSGCIVTIGCKKIAFTTYLDAVSSIDKFYADPRAAIKQWKDKLGV